MKRATSLLFCLSTIKKSFTSISQSANFGSSKLNAMLNFNTILESPRVLLRPMQLQDLEVIRPLTTDTEMWYYFTSDLSDENTLTKWVENAVQEWKEQRSLPFSILDPATQAFMGCTRIGNLSAEHQRVEIGWTWIAKPYHGTGINGHVKELLFEYLFTQTDTLRIEFKTDALNIPARKAMQKVGLVEEGVLRSHTLMTNNRRRDTIFYSILKEEWEERRK